MVIQAAVNLVKCASQMTGAPMVRGSCIRLCCFAMATGNELMNCV